MKINKEIGFYDRLLNEQMSYKQNTIWYSMGSLCSAGTSVLLMLYVTRILGVEEAGVFAIANSIAQLMLTVGWFSTRQFQVSDIHEDFKFHEYLSLKLLTSVISVLGGIVYSLALHNYGYKLWITFLFCLFYVGDIFADLDSARFQQTGKLYLAGMSYVLRYVGNNIVFLVVLLITHNLSAALICTLLYTIAELAVFDYPFIKRISTISVCFDFHRIFKLSKNCFPLFISSFVTNYIVNIPKNAIDIFLTPDIQTFYNIIFMPSSVINLLCMFAFVPLYTQIAKTWHEGSYREFIHLVVKVLLLASVMGLAVLALTFVAGIPVLSLVYGVSLAEYKLPLIILIVAGCFNGLNAIVAYLFTVIRKQHFLLGIYVTAMTCCQLCINQLIRNYGILGASLDYLIGMASITIMLLVIFLILMHKEKGRD